jgi:hypothetical protein
MLAEKERPIEIRSLSGVAQKRLHPIEKRTVGRLLRLVAFSSVQGILLTANQRS